MPLGGIEQPRRDPLPPVRRRDLEMADLGHARHALTDPRFGYRLTDQAHVADGDAVAPRHEDLAKSSGLLPEPFGEIALLPERANQLDQVFGAGETDVDHGLHATAQ